MKDFPTLFGQYNSRTEDEVTLIERWLENNICLTVYKTEKLTGDRRPINYSALKRFLRQTIVESNKK